MDHTNPPAGMIVRARVHPRALEHMPLFFDATAPSIFTELIQNARRGGANRVHIAVEPADPRFGDGPSRVTVRDNGNGIADPAVLLSFGQSGWDDPLARRERPAGMGLACLARRGCTVSSRAQTPSSQPATGWRMTLEPGHFLGKIAATAVPDTTAPAPNGTCVTFEATESLNTLRAAVAGASRYAPLWVTFNGQELMRHDFLEGALRIEHWNGLVLGVLKSRQPLYNESDLNFHGLTVNVRLPHVQGLDGETWTVRAQVEDCPELELVLPARKEAVENDFMERIRDQARLEIYRAVAPLDPPPRLAFEDHAQAARAGIQLPVPPAELWPWRPATADVDDWTRDVPLSPVGPDALVVAYDADPPDTQPFHRAARSAGLAPRLFEADRRLAGYGWYDALARLTDVRARIDIKGITYTEQALHQRFKDAARNGSPQDNRLHGDCRPQDCPLQGDCRPQDRADSIHLSLEIASADGTRDTVTIPADIVFLDTAYGWLDDACPVIASDSDIGADELAALLRRAYFCPSDDSDVDSYETQGVQFDDAALHLALKHVASADEATRTAISQAVWREIHWLMPKDRTVDIAVRGNRIDVTLGRPADGSPAHGSPAHGSRPAECNPADRDPQSTDTREEEATPTA
ncbi:ATP-binding protein [Candidatus Rariloculus sp.]|uniref:ATP-binding protein n=1 Tax=Candidatus Rariloculus sp. TaxID=3101265 RepID=UPI003D11E3A8